MSDTGVMEFTCPVCGLVFTDPCCEDADQPLYCSDACTAAGLTAYLLDPDNCITPPTQSGDRA